MNLLFNQNLASGYKSKSQIARVLTENWVKEYAFCPNCLSKLYKLKANSKAKDFYCENCQEIYELKSKEKSFGKKVVDGEYSAMIESINSSKNPNFLFLTHECLHVKDFLVVPKHFLTPNLIEKRKPLGQNARRAGWTGCNMLYDKIASRGKIYIIKDKIPLQQIKVMASFQNAKNLQIENIEKRTWMMEVLKLLEKLDKTFLLNDVYHFEKKLIAIFPNNKNTKAKIRQQLQFLRDKGMIKFLERGRYEKIYS